jgi:hypothetical protein
MDGSQFDVWTRRRFGAAAGGLAAALLGLAQLDDAQAKKHHKKRCKKLFESCTPGGRKCCQGNLCESLDAGSKGSFLCCKAKGKPCQTGQCCPEFDCLEGFCTPV